jgi:S1-C subfamily serine protease
MIASQSGGSVGIGFAIPINDAKKIVEELKLNGKIKRAWLGIGLDGITEDDIRELKLTDSKGAVVKQIMEGSPASKSGIQIQDVIVKLDSKDIETPEDVISYVRESKVGKKIEIKLLRAGQAVRLQVTTAERPN